MLSSILQEHFRKVAEQYSQITPGQQLQGHRENWAVAEKVMFEELSSARENLREHVSRLGRERPITVKTGAPKGSWSHVYYVSFHDAVNSDGPQVGFYPVFLLSVDQRQCHLALALAAASVGISGKGGWSKKRGGQLQERAKFLGRNLKKEEKDGWHRGPINLGPNGDSLREESGVRRSAGRGYECCSIISKQFDPHNPPDDLSEWLRRAFGFFDVVYSDEIDPLKALIRSPSKEENLEQRNAAITGAEAEEFFMGWVRQHRLEEWGLPVSRTDTVGLGYDIEFPDEGIKVEVKGCREGIQNIRVTEREWDVAEKEKDKYWLAIVSNLNQVEKQVDLIQDPYRKLKGSASEQVRKQVTYTIPRNALQEHAGENE